MNQKVPVAFVLILTICLVVLLYFYFNTTLEKYQTRAFIDMQNELLDIYSDKVKGKEIEINRIESLKEKYGQNEFFLKHLSVIEVVDGD